MLLWDVDPGLIRLKHAGKTIIAILISLWLTQNQSLYTMLIAAVGSGISMQGIIAKSLSSRLLQLLIFDLCYFSAFALGVIVRHSANLTALALIILGFTVNYIRRFDLQNSMAPTMIWLLCFLATILPLTSSTHLWINLQALLIGMLVSAVVYLFLFPENYSHLFVMNANHIFEDIAVGLSDLRRYLSSKKKGSSITESQAFQQKDILAHLLDSNQTIADNLMFMNKTSLMSKTLIHQYALVNAYKIILDSYQIISCENYKLPRHIRYALSVLNKDFARLFRSVSMQKDYRIAIQYPMISLKNWSNKLSENPPKDPELIMLLLNLKLGFHLFNKNLAKLLWLKNEN